MKLTGAMIVLATLLTTGTAHAAPYVLMFERDSDAAAGLELAFITYPTFDDLVGHTNSTTVFSPINVAADFSTTGLTFDGSQYILTFEREQDTTGGLELAFITYPTFNDLIGHTNSTTVFSPINVAPDFSTTGLTFDGSQYILTFEREQDTIGGLELAFITYASFDDLIGHTNSTTVFSPINVAADFSTTGLTFDGSQYILTFEREQDTTGGLELAFITYPTFNDLIGHTNSTTVFSPINVAADFSTTGLMALVDFGGNGPPDPDPDPNTVPLPSTFMLMMAAIPAGLAQFALARRARRQRA